MMHRIAHRAHEPVSRWRRASRRAIHDERGSLLVEIAVIMPAFCLLLFGILQFAFVCLGYCSSAYSARQAARFASYRSNTSLAVTGGYGSTPQSAAAQTATLTSVLQQTLFTPGATTPVISFTYSNPLGTPQSGNYIGNVIFVNVTWSERVGIAPFFQNVNVAVQTGRVIVR